MCACRWRYLKFFFWIFHSCVFTVQTYSATIVIALQGDRFKRKKPHTHEQ